MIPVHRVETVWLEGGKANSTEHMRFLRMCFVLFVVHIFVPTIPLSRLYSRAGQKGMVFYFSCHTYTSR